jgi:hypothetical protein
VTGRTFTMTPAGTAGVILFVSVSENGIAAGPRSSVPGDCVADKLRVPAKQVRGSGVLSIYR